MSGLRHKRFVVATLRLDRNDVRVKYGDLLVARNEGAATLDWECVIMPFAPLEVAHGAHRLDVVTLEGRALAGDAILVRSVEGTHVFRGAGPLDGFPANELRDDAPDPG